MKKLKFEPEDFEGNYGSLTDCPVARATKRELEYTSPSIGGITVGDNDGDIFEYNIYSVYLNEEKIEQDRFSLFAYNKIKQCIQNGTFQNAYIILDKDV